jgi:hypothetical protein
MSVRYQAATMWRDRDTALNSRQDTLDPDVA